MPPGQVAGDGMNTPPTHDDGAQPLSHHGLQPFLVPAPEDEQSPNPTPIDSEDDTLTYPQTPSGYVPTRPNTPGPLTGYPIQHDQITLATVEGVQTPHVTTTSGEALYHHNLWTDQTAADGTIYEVPTGFRRNTGRDHVPFLIIDKDGELHQADYVQVVLSRDPLVLAIREGDPHLYGSALHATPYYDGEEYRPRYDAWSLATLERRYQGARKTDRAIRELKDVTLMAEIERFRSIAETGKRLDTELERVLKQKHDIGMARERCVIRLEQANTIGRIENLEAEASEVVRRATKRIRKD